MDKGFYIGTVGSKAVYVNPSEPCDIIDPKGGLFYGDLGHGSMMRCFHKDKFIIKRVPEYALLKKEGEFIRVWDHYGHATEQEIETMLSEGWKRKNEYIDG